MTSLLVPSRRSFIQGAAASVLAAPAIVRAEIIMPVRNIIRPEKKQIIREYAQPGFIIIQADPRFVEAIFDNSKRVVVTSEPITGKPIFTQVQK